MKLAEKIIKYILMAGLVLCILFVVNIAIILGMTYWTNGEDAYLQVGRIAEKLKKTEDGYTLPQENLMELDEWKGFAMLIDDSGDVVWSYKLPKDVPLKYSRKDIASITRWYLRDYPVFTWIVEDGLFIAGREKNTLWRINLVYAVDSLNAYILYLPGLLLLDLVCVIFFPLFALRRGMKRKERERTEWIAGVSHDIRTPLSLILGNAAALKSLDEEGEVQRRAEMIEEQALRMRTQIANLNTENKLSRGLGHWNREEILLSSLLRDILCDAANGDSQGKYEFEMDISGNMERGKVYGDRDLIRRMLENLVQNSIKHNPEGCKITVRLKEQRLILHNCLLVVEDDGVGMGPEQLRYVNRRLQAKKLPEHGLGLRLVKQIGELYHWRVRFARSGENGLECRICLRVGL